MNACMYVWNAETAAWVEVGPDKADARMLAASLKEPSEQCLPDRILSGVPSVLHIQEAVSFCILQASIKVCH